MLSHTSDDYDELEDHQYNLVFNPWDAQFEDCLATGNYQIADEPTKAHFNRVLERVDALSDQCDTSDLSFEQKKRYIADWAGEGICL